MALLLNAPLVRRDRIDERAALRLVGLNDDRRWVLGAKRLTEDPERGRTERFCASTSADNSPTVIKENIAHRMP